MKLSKNPASDFKCIFSLLVVTNYDSMFSDLPQYPSHSYVKVPSGLRGRSAGPTDPGPLLSGTINAVTSSSGLQVTGKDRALFFRRPVLQMSYVMPLPTIRYAREMSLSVDDLARHDERRKMRNKQLQDQKHQQGRPPDYFQEHKSASSHHHHHHHKYDQQPKSSFGN